MPSYLMPPESDKPLHEKLLELFEDSIAQYHSMTQLNIPDKIKIKSHDDFNKCLRDFAALPKQECLVAINDKDHTEIQYKNFCIIQYKKYLSFYYALETLLVRHYTECSHLPGNEYLLISLNKMPDKYKEDVKNRTIEIEDSPRTPRDKLDLTDSPRKRSNSSPLAWLSHINQSPRSKQDSSVHSNSPRDTEKDSVAKLH